jgi:hypothetical protein
MANITLRATKGSPLSSTEVDNNFTQINNELGSVTNNPTLWLTNKTLTSARIKGPLITGGYYTTNGTSTVGGGSFTGANYLVAPEGPNAASGAGYYQALTSDFTIDFWMKLDFSGAIANARLFGKGAAGASGNLQLQYSGIGSNFILHINGITATYVSPVTMDNEWHYITICRSSGSIYFYVDGLLSASSPQTQSGSINSSADFYVGGSVDGIRFKGTLSGFRYIIGTALYTKLIFPVPNTEPDSRYDFTTLILLFDQDAGSQTLFDYSGNSRTLTNFGVTQSAGNAPQYVNYGQNGQVLASTGDTVQWMTIPYEVTRAGTETLTNKTISSGKLTGTLTANNSVGTLGQYLQSTGTGVQWATPSSGDVTLTGTQTLTNKTISAGVITGTLTAGGAVGTSGQVLQSTGTGVQWATVSGGGGTSLPTQTGNSGKYLTTDGTTASWATIIASGGDVTLTGTQTLTNKTLTSPAISSPTITGTITAGGGAGVNGQVLQSTGTGIVWATVSGGAAVLNFDFGGFARIFTDPVLYLLDKIGMDHGSFASPTEPSVNAGTF